jgi:hypothetical protein
MATSKLIPPPPLARKFVHYVLSFFVTIGVAFLPLWGGDVIPGFHTILDVYPKNLQDVIPFASIAMSAAAIFAQFFGGGSPQPRHLKTLFIVTFVSLIILVLASYIAYKVVVIRIEVPAAHKTVSYLVGSRPLPTCECAKQGLDIRNCIGPAISANPDEVAACFSQEEITMRSIVLSVLYILLMFSAGMLIGLVILKEAPKAQPAMRMPLPPYM